MQVKREVILINPDNPSGNFLEKNDVIRLCKVLKEKNVTLIFDESFIDFAEKERRYTLFNDEILSEYPNLIVVKSISKSYGVPGLRLGVLATADCDYITKIKKQMQFGISIHLQNTFCRFMISIIKRIKQLAIP